MKIIKYLLILFTICIVSLYFFPFEFDGYPGLNTKKIMAVIGLIFFGYNQSRHHNATIDKRIFLLMIWSGVVSLIGLFSITYNNTPDYSYAGYILSMTVWLSAAYAVCNIVRCVHGEVSVRILANYLLAVCVCQCFLALYIDMNPDFKASIDAIVNQGEDFLNSNNVNRLYGIGASLDVAGIRFSSILILVTYLILKEKELSTIKYLLFYVVSFIVLAIIGNMIARTTTVGIVIALAYVFYSLNKEGLSIPKTYLFYAIGVLVAIIPFVVYLYDNDPDMHKNLRFAFEGFFNLYERGEWAVASNDKLKTMYVFPETFKTWVIGDGYFSSPRDIDPYFTKDLVGGYYMGTDVGFLRFIFYFGLVGLLAFCAFFVQVCKSCINKYPFYRDVFIMFLLLNFAVWFKVATDIFLVFALFLVLQNQQQVDSDEQGLIRI